MGGAGSAPGGVELALGDPGGGRRWLQGCIRAPEEGTRECRLGGDWASGLSGAT